MSTDHNAPPPPTPPQSDDDVHDVVGWDEAGGPRPPRQPSKLPGSRGFRVGLAVILLTVLLGLWLLPDFLQEKRSDVHTAAQMNVLVTFDAQQQYREQFGLYADSGWRLFQAGLIAPDLAGAFEGWQGNGDAGARPAAPKAGYFFRVLQGSAAAPSGYRSLDDAGAPGLTRFAVQARPAEPAISGEWEYLQLEDGAGWMRKVIADPADPQYGQYSLDGDLSPTGLQAQGWQPWWGD